MMNIPFCGFIMTMLLSLLLDGMGIIFRKNHDDTPVNNCIVIFHGIVLYYIKFIHSEPYQMQENQMQ